MTRGIAINGAGRIGRAVLRVTAERKRPQVVGLNDLAPVGQTAHLLRHDTTLGRFPQPVEVAGEDLMVGSGTIAYSRAPTLDGIDWGGTQPQIVVEATGRFTAREQAAEHLSNGVERVVVSANSRDADALICFGVNHQRLTGSEAVISASSCTTNCVAAVTAPILRELGVRRLMLLTVHCYNAGQSLVDAAQADLRRARAAGLNLIPTTTGAAWAVERVLPELESKVSGYAVRVPAAQVSLVDLVIETERSSDQNGVMEILGSAAERDLAGTISVSREPLVSSDFVGAPESAVVDAEFVEVKDRQVRLLAWYDNEMGYANRLVDLVLFLAERDA